MAVDLSRIGLVGQEAAHQSFESAAMVKRTNVETEAKQLELDTARRFEELSQKAAQRFREVSQGQTAAAVDADEIASRTNSDADPFEVMGRVFLSGGAVQQGLGMLKAGSDIRKQESDIRRDEVQNRTDNLEFIIKGSELAGRLIGGAQNETEFDAGVDELVRSGYFSPEQGQQAKSLEWSPDLSAFFADRAITAKDKAVADRDMMRIEETARHNRTTEIDANTRVRLQAARDKEQATHNAYIRKNGGKEAPAATAPNKAELESVKGILTGQFFQGVDFKGDDPDQDAGMVSLTAQIASRAKVLVREDRSLDWETAVQRAAIEAKDAGDFFVDQAKFYETEDLVVHAPKGRTPDAPIALKGKVNKSKLVSGRYYRLPDGRSFRWNGTEGIPVD